MPHQGQLGSVAILFVSSRALCVAACGKGPCHSVTGVDVERPRSVWCSVLPVGDGGQRGKEGKCA